MNSKVSTNDPLACPSASEGATLNHDPVAGLVFDIVTDAQTLINQQFAMPRAEVRDDVNMMSHGGKHRIDTGVTPQKSFRAIQENLSWITHRQNESNVT